MTELSAFCKKNDLYLYLDGARIGSSLTVPSCDMTMAEVAKLVDAFYIGGTKNGALIGEAIVLINDDFKKNFRHCLK